MKILYGIQTTGNGHITRSLRMISELEKIGHQIDIVTSGPKTNLIKRKHTHFKGFTFYYYKSGKVNYFKTLLNINLFQFIKDIKSLNLNEYEIIITDYEPITSWASLYQEKCFISLSNQSSFYSKKIPRPSVKDYLSEFFMRKLCPVQCPIGIHYKNYDDFIFGPVIREDLTNSDLKEDDFNLIYLPQISPEIIYENLKNINDKFVIYSDKKSNIKSDKIIFKQINYNDFKHDLLNCKSIITAAGFQTTSEALFLKKKLMVVPIGGQWEQKCNAEALKNLGIFVSDIKNIRDFIKSEKVTIEVKDSTKLIIEKIKKLI